MSTMILKIFKQKCSSKVKVYEQKMGEIQQLIFTTINMHGYQSRICVIRNKGSHEAFTYENMIRIYNEHTI